MYNIHSVHALGPICTSTINRYGTGKDLFSYLSQVLYLLHYFVHLVYKNLPSFILVYDFVYLLKYLHHGGVEYNRGAQAQIRMY